MDDIPSVTNKDTGNLYPPNASDVGAVSSTQFGKDVTITLYVSMLIVVSFIGTVGNILIIGALLVHKQLRSLGNVFTGNLAIYDLCVSLVITPLSVAGVFHPDFFMKHNTVCTVIAQLWSLSCWGSYLSITAIAINRYVAICHRILYRKVYNRTLISLHVAILWVYIFTFVLIPHMLVESSVGILSAYDTKTNSCSPLPTANATIKLAYFIYFLLGSILLPVVLIFTSYCKIFLFAKRSKQRLMKYSSPQQPTIKTIDMRLLKSILIILFMFMLLWSPLVILKMFDVSGAWPRWVYQLVNVLIFANSSINSIIYAASNPSFREGYTMCLKIVCGSIFRKNSNTDFQLTTVSTRGPMAQANNSSALKSTKLSGRPKMKNVE